MKLSMCFLFIVYMVKMWFMNVYGELLCQWSVPVLWVATGIVSTHQAGARAWLHGDTNRGVNAKLGYVLCVTIGWP